MYLRLDQTAFVHYNNTWQVLKCTKHPGGQIYYYVVSVPFPSAGADTTHLTRSNEVIASEASPAALALPEASALTVVCIPQHLASAMTVNGMESVVQVT